MHNRKSAESRSFRKRYGRSRCRCRRERRSEMASEVTKRLRDNRHRLWEECKTLADGAAGESRNMTPEEDGKWNVLQEERTKLDTRIRAALDAEKRLKETDDAFDALSGRKPDQGQAARTAGGGQMLEEVRKWARGEEGAPKFLEVRHQAPGPINYRILTYAQGGSPAGASGII